MPIVKSSRNQDQLLLDGYRYRRTNNSPCIWRCCKNSCADRVRSNGSQYIHVTDHSHTPVPEEEISMQFRSKIIEEAAASQDPPRRIIHEALLAASKEDGTAVPNYTSSQRTIEWKGRRNHIPLPRPTSFGEIMIPDDLKVTNEGSRFLLYDKQSSDHRMMIWIGCRILTTGTATERSR